MEVHQDSIYCKKNKNKDSQSNVIEGESRPGIGLTLMDINIASSAESYFLMASAPMTGCDEWKYEGEKAEDCRDSDNHVKHGRRCIVKRMWWCTVQPGRGITLLVAEQLGVGLVARRRGEHRHHHPGHVTKRADIIIRAQNRSMAHITPGNGTVKNKHPSPYLEMPRSRAIE